MDTTRIATAWDERRRDGQRHEKEQHGRLTSTSYDVIRLNRPFRVLRAGI